jgi:hypothetical protein
VVKNQDWTTIFLAYIRSYGRQLLAHVSLSIERITLMTNAMSDDRERLLNGDWIVYNVAEDENFDLTGSKIARPVLANDAAECGRILYAGFAAIAEQHNFPPDFLSVEVATGVASKHPAMPKSAT